MTDPIADMFNRLKNAQAVRQETALIPFSKLKQEIAVVLKNEGFILDFEKRGRGVGKKLEVKLKYLKNNQPAIMTVRRLSRPGQRKYMGWRKIFPDPAGQSLSIISTPGGIMSDRQARKVRLGGEVVGKIN